MPDPDAIGALGVTRMGGLLKRLTTSAGGAGPVFLLNIRSA